MKAKPAPLVPEPTRKIDKYEVHPFRLLIPEKTEEEYAEYLDYLRLHKQHHLITRDIDDRILDGRATLRGCLELGFEPKFAPKRIATNYASFVLGTMAGKVYPIALRAFTAARLLPELEQERKNFTGRKTTSAGKMVGGVNHLYVTEARALLDEDSPIIPYVDAGIIETFVHVRKLADMDDEKRDACLAKIGSKKEVAVILREAAARDGDEWYTPPDIVAAVTWAFGGKIVCDPAHPVGGGSPVVATYRYTSEDNGLSKPWYDGTYLNPPFSGKKKWIEKALSEADEQKRIYVLIPSNQSSIPMQALNNRAFDVLYLAKRPVFISGEVAVYEDDDNDDPPKEGRGRNSLMIVALNCSVEPLVEMGIEGDIHGMRSRRELEIDERGRWHLKARPKVEISPADLPPPEELQEAFDANRMTVEEERAFLEMKNRERDLDEEYVKRGKAAVAEARRDMARALEAEREARKSRKAKKAAAV
jgi:hypothetical protein